MTELPLAPPPHTHRAHVYENILKIVDLPFILIHLNMVHLHYPGKYAVHVVYPMAEQYLHSMLYSMQCMEGLHSILA